MTDIEKNSQVVYDIQTNVNVSIDKWVEEPVIFRRWGKKEHEEANNDDEVLQ